MFLTKKKNSCRGKKKKTEIFMHIRRSAKGHTKSKIQNSNSIIEREGIYNILWQQKLNFDSRIHTRLLAWRTALAAVEDYAKETF